MTGITTYLSILTLHVKMKANKTMREQEVSNHRKRKVKESESNTDLIVHNQTLKNQKELSILTLLILSVNVNRLNFPIKRHCLANLIKK
jgi:hypothetical protein